MGSHRAHNRRQINQSFEARAYAAWIRGTLPRSGHDNLKEAQRTRRPNRARQCRLPEDIVIRSKGCAEKGSSLGELVSEFHSILILISDFFSA